MLALEETKKYCLTQLTTFTFEYWNSFFYEHEKNQTQYIITKHKKVHFFFNHWNAKRINMHKVQNNFSLRRKIKLFFPLCYPHYSTSLSSTACRSAEKGLFSLFGESFYSAWRNTKHLLFLLSSMWVKLRLRSFPKHFAKYFDMGIQDSYA